MTEWLIAWGLALLFGGAIYVAISVVFVVLERWWNRRKP